MNKFILTLIGLMTSLITSAQDKPEMADLLRSNGKIYTVVAVCLTILIGLFIYVFILDRKISRFENETKNRK
jgi:tetrahydromethanopterin S-methyltransferase subunit D